MQAIFFKEGENPEHRFSLFLFALFFLTSTIITNLVVRVTTSLCAIADDIFTDTFITAWLQRWYLVCATVLNLCLTFSPSKLEWTAAVKNSGQPLTVISQNRVISLAQGERGKWRRVGFGFMHAYRAVFN